MSALKCCSARVPILKKICAHLSTTGQMTPTLLTSTILLVLLSRLYAGRADTSLILLDRFFGPIEWLSLRYCSRFIFLI